jgi:hypothetical protein
MSFRFFPFCSLLAALALGAAVAYPVRAADPDGLTANTASDSSTASTDEGPHISSPDLRPSPGTPATAVDSVPQAPSDVPDAPSGTEASAASVPITPDLPPPTDTGPTPPPSPNVTMNLINLMVKRGLITKEDAQSLIQEAEQEAASAQPAAAPAGPPAPSPAVPADEDDVRVNYVPDVVKNEIRDDVKADVLKQARDEHWGKDNSIPDWVHRFHVTGDIRVRVEGDYFPAGNDDTGAFTNFNAINTGSPFDTSAISNPRFPPEYDVDQDRYRPRIRARIGAGIDLGDNFTAGMRIGTGQDDSPTTQNQTLGLANNGQGGDFSKYAVWLDRAFIRYDIGDPQENLSVSVGRFDNPFLSSSMIWASEIGFDGIVAKGNYEVTPGVTPFLTAGFFPVFNTDFNFASDQPAKFSSEDKWLEAAQAGVTWKINKDFTATGAVAMYYFQNVAGRLSDPFTPLSTADQGDTDDTRPSFAQNGNTYMEIRNIAPTAANDFGTIDQFQYYGLATGFNEAALTGQIDFSRFDPFHLQLLGEFVDNVAYSQNFINNIAVNNRGAGGTGSFNGGNKGYNLRLTVGQPVLQKLWDWNLNLTYRYVESDATIDGFTDADFGGPLVGTNLKGYIVGGYLALSPRVSLGLRFMSADSIAGPTYHNDLFQFDINAKF